MKSTSIIKYTLMLAMIQLGCGDISSRDDQRSLTNEEKPSSQILLVKDERSAAFTLFDSCPDRTQCYPIEESVVIGKELCLGNECGPIHEKPDCGSFHTLQLNDDIKYCSENDSSSEIKIQALNSRFTFFVALTNPETSEKSLDEVAFAMGPISGMRGPFPGYIGLAKKLRALYAKRRQLWAAFQAAKRALEIAETIGGPAGIQAKREASQNLLSAKYGLSMVWQEIRSVLRAMGL